MKVYNKRIVNNRRDNSYEEIGEFIEFNNLSDEELKKFDGLDLLISKSKNEFTNRCSKIKVPVRSDHYHPLIIEHQNEIAYRKARDEEYKFRDVSIFICTNSKIQFRNNKAVIPIDTSGNQIKRAYRIIDTFIKAVIDFNGSNIVETADRDNLYINLFGDRFSFVMAERKVKNRRIAGSLQDNSIKKFKPTYQSVYSGELEIELKEISNYQQMNNVPKSLYFSDKINYPIENCLGEIFISLLKVANEAKICRFINERENKRIREEQEQLDKIEEENKRLAKEIEERNHHKQNLLENIEGQMERWFKSQNLLKYSKEVEAIICEISDEVEKELLLQYITQVNQKAKELYPIEDILNGMKIIGIDEFK